MDIITKYLGRWGDMGVLRPVVLGVTLYMTYDAYQWAARFAETTLREGPEVAMIIAAVITPISALQGYVFTQYTAACHQKKE